MTAPLRGALHLPVLEADKAYLTDMLWLPKRGMPLEPIKKALQYARVEKGISVYERLWHETRDHLIVPREFVPPHQYTEYDFPFIDLRPTTFPRSGLVFNGELWAEQEEAAKASLATDGGLLSLSPGQGKTVIALHKAAKRGVPTLVVVHNSTIFDQWKNEEIPTHLQLPNGEKVGVVQGAKFDWERPITVAMIHTLANRIRDGKIPWEFRKHFGYVIYDECHHVGAHSFHTTASLILGERDGLSATIEREDHLEFIFKYHLGGVYFQDLSMEMLPKIYFQLTPTRMDLELDPRVRDTTGVVNISKLRSAVGETPKANEFRYRCIKAHLDAGRKVFCLSHSEQQLITLHQRFPGSALLTANTPRQQRLKLVQESKIAFSIAVLGTEGLNDKWIESFFLLTPFKNKKDLRQSLGRLQRRCEGKQHPQMIIFDDVYIAPFHNMCRHLKGHLRDLGLGFENLPAPNL